MFTLSTPLLIQTICDLILNGDSFFNHHSIRTHFDLELHLRCVFAGLRLLCVHGGTLSFSVFDELYNKMFWWQSFYQAQKREFDEKKCEQGKVRNYNCEFLIAYIRDLVSSIPSDQSIISSVASRLAATACSLGYMVISFSISNLTFLVLEADCGCCNVFKTAVQRKYPPSAWHGKYRNMDDLCLSVLLVRQDIEALSKDTMDSGLLETMECCVLNQLIEILDKEAEQVLQDRTGRAIRTGSNAVGASSRTRKGHFVYGIAKGPWKY